VFGSVITGRHAFEELSEVTLTIEQKEQMPS